MNIALINSPRLFFKGVSFASSPPPLAIAYLNGYLNSNNIKTEIWDLNILLMKNTSLHYLLSTIDSDFTIDNFLIKYDFLINATLDYFFSKIDISDSDIVCISIIDAESLKIMLPFMKRLKGLYPSKKIIVGG